MNSRSAEPYTIPLYRAAQVRELVGLAIGQAGIPGHVLMQRAAQASFDAMARKWPQAGRLAVLCGPGNNGGDGYEIARIARAAGMQVDVARVGPLPASGDAVKAHLGWTGAGGTVQAWCEGFRDGPFSQADVICDAIFGLGIGRPVSGSAESAILAINARSARQHVLAVDLPSGLDPDTGAVQGVAVRADLTASFIGRKLGLYVGKGPDHAGECSFSDLGVPGHVLRAVAPAADLLAADELRAALPPRARDAHKGSHGHVLLVGGDLGMAGAILLACRGALRTGAGLVSVATRAEHASGFAAAQPEAMFRGMADPGDLDESLSRASVVAIGPGLGQGDWGARALERCLASGLPLVLDADALNLLARAPVRLPGTAVITPHPGEAGRLLGLGAAQVQADRFAAAAALRERYGAVVVLKGAGTVVAGERVALCPFGNPGMGVGGMGDVLTGVIAALLAQGLAPEAAARTGVVLHALAGDRAAAGGQRGLLPTDLIGQLRAVTNP